MTGQLRGRSQAWAQLTGAMASASGDGGAVVLLEGGSGTGKTSLLHQVVRYGRTKDFRVLTNVGDTPSTAALLWALSESPRGTVWTEPPAALQGRLRARIGSRAGREPVLIALDDLHTANGATARVLRDLLEMPRHDNVVW